MPRILAAVDSSGVAQLVVQQAVELARTLGGKVRVVHAVPVPAPVPPAPGGLAIPQTRLLPEVLAGAETLVERLLESVPDELRDGTQVGIGGAAELVCAVARSYDADVVVIGAHRYGALARALGTTAARVVNRIDRPVLVVRPTPEPAPVLAGERPPRADSRTRPGARP